MAASIDELFSEEAIIPYPEKTAASQLQHEYSDIRRDNQGNPINFEGATILLAALRKDVAAWYQQQTGQVMDTYTLGEMLRPVQERFWVDPRFESAFRFLQLPLERRDSIPIPWWNEIVGGELEHRVESERILVKLGPRHSYETQLIRSGYHLPIKSVSVAGLILSNDGYLVVGLRGGKSFPNTYHLNAGALRVTAGLKTGEESIYDIFKHSELEPEFGIKDSDIQEATVHSRIMDYSIERGPMYDFLVKTKFSREELQQRWEQNPDEDKKEHREILFIPATTEGVNSFIREQYVGVCQNKVQRGDNERHLLHPAALALASFSGMPLSELRSLYQEGLH